MNIKTAYYNLVLSASVTYVSTESDGKSKTYPLTEKVINTLELNKYINTYMEYDRMLENIKGDGAATVSVEAEFSDKTYGQGISLKVRTTLTCNQSLEDVETAHQIAATITQDQLQHNIPEVRRIYEENFSNKP